MPTRDNLVYQASIERDEIEKNKRKTTIEHRRELSRQGSFSDVINRLNDDGIELIRSTSDSDVLDIAVIVNCCHDSRGVLVTIVQAFTAAGILIKHIESRPDCAHHGELEMFLDIQARKMVFVKALDHIMSDKIDRVEVRSTLDPCEDKAWTPKHVGDLDQCMHVIVKYEPTEDPKHPVSPSAPSSQTLSFQGFGDVEYIQRRAQLNAIANAYRHGDKMPIVKYLPIEHETWRQAYKQLRALRETHTCIEYQRNVKAMEDVGLITPDRIPCLRQLSDYIHQRTGFQLRPCGGLLSARDFLASLAFRVFQTTLYIRHHSKPHHCPEPDVIHEILGHCPMFADPEMAQLSQEIGLLSLGASDEQIERLSTLYWFIIEFGLCEQEGKLKAIGAGLISAYGELQHACSDAPEHAPFDPVTAAVRKYEDSDYQPLYFVAKSIGDAMKKVKAYALTLNLTEINVYCPYTQSVHQVKRAEYIKENLKRLRNDVNTLTDLMQKTQLVEK